MRPFAAAALATVTFALAAPVVAQQTHAGTPSGTVNSNSRTTQSDPRTTKRQYSRIAKHKAKVKRTETAAARAKAKAQPKR